MGLRSTPSFFCLYESPSLPFTELVVEADLFWDELGGVAGALCVWPAFIGRRVDFLLAAKGTKTERSTSSKVCYYSNQA